MEISSALTRVNSPIRYAAAESVQSPFTPIADIPPQLSAIPAPVAVEAESAAPSRGTAKGFVLGLLAAAAIAGVAVYVAGQADSQPKPAPTSQSQVHVPGLPDSVARESLAQLRFLDRVGSQGEGGLHEEVLGIFNRKITPEKALHRLSQGDAVIYLESKDATPHEIKDLQQLESLNDQVEYQQIRKGVREGLREVEDGLREAGEGLKEIGREFRRGFEEGRR
ncbi:MAG: hypothetical protein FJX76_02350 [Armatimonadetes bacterium]|nr:hypothetical protein [Armatimonadota bacterium]